MKNYCKTLVKIQKNDEDDLANALKHMDDEVNRWVTAASEDPKLKDEVAKIRKGACGCNQCVFRIMVFNGFDNWLVEKEAKKN